MLEGFAELHNCTLYVFNSRIIDLYILSLSNRGSLDLKSGFRRWSLELIGKACLFWLGMYSIR